MTNMFFKTVAEAIAYRKEHKCGGVLLELKPRMRKNSRAWFEYEIAEARKTRGEIVDPAVTPVCLTWNIPIDDCDEDLINK